MANWNWTYLGQLFEDGDAQPFLPAAASPNLTEVDVTKKPDGGVMIIFSGTDESSGDQYGAATVDAVTLGSIAGPVGPALVRNPDGGLVLTSRVTASDLYSNGNSGPGASSYEAAQGHVGLLLVRRNTLNQGIVNGFSFDTGVFPP
jgi:hypothetical protein